MTITDLMHAAHDIATDPNANHPPQYLRGMAGLIAAVAADSELQAKAIRHDVYVDLLTAQAEGVAK